MTFGVLGFLATQARARAETHAFGSGWNMEKKKILLSEDSSFFYFTNLFPPILAFQVLKSVFEEIGMSVETGPHWNSFIALRVDSVHAFQKSDHQCQTVH